MQRRRVLIAGNERLFTMSISALLQARPDLDVVVADASDPEVTAKVRKAQPQVIVVPCMTVSEGLAAVAQLLSEHPGTTIITVGLNPNVVNIYRSESILHASERDLLQAIAAS